MAFVGFVGFVLPSRAEAVDCTVPISGNMTISSSCSFSGTTNGVDAGTGTTNSAALTVSSGTLTINAGQTVAAGSLIPVGGSIAVISGGAIKPGAPLWAYDADADGYPKETTMSASLTQMAGHRRRNLMTSMITRDCRDFYDSGITCDPSTMNMTDGTHSGAYQEGSGTPASSYRELPKDNSTVGLWHMNEASGTSVADSSGNANTGTATGTTVVSGKLGNARSFNGSSDYVDLGAGSSLNITGDITIELWCYFSSAGQNCMISKYPGAGGNGYGLYVDSNNKLNFYDGTAWRVSNSAVSAGQWHHLAVTQASTTVNLYLDGVLDATVTGAARTGNAYSLMFGKNTTTASYGAGTYDEVRISNVARTPEEIKADAQRRPYASYIGPVNDLTQTPGSWSGLNFTAKGMRTADGETPASTTSLVAQWNLNETSGTTAASGGTCGATCNGTLTNFASTTSQDQAAGTGWTSANRRWGAGALMFDGTNDYVSTNLSANITSDYTVSAWVKVNSYQQGMVGMGGYDSGTASNYFEFFKSDSSYCSGALSFNPEEYALSVCGSTKDNNWHFYALQRSAGTTASLYVDGILVSQKSGGSWSLRGIGKNIKIGSDRSNSAGTYFNGTIDNLSIYSRALTASEILANYQAGNIEFQTRTSADNSTWEAWKPVTGETAIDSLNNNEDNSKVYELGVSNIGVNQNWSKLDNTIPSASDTTSTNGRLPLGTAGRGDVTAVSHPTILKDGSTYKMWYAGNDGTNQFTYYATSPDGLTWTKYDNTIATTCDTTCEGNGKIGGGSSGKNPPKGDTDRVLPKTVLKDGSTYKMWYMGRDGTNYRIYYATSSDGLTWTKYDDTTPAVSDTTSSNGRIPLGNSGRGDSAQVSNPVVIKDGNWDIPGDDNFKMWYIGNDGTNSRIFYATSPDGLTWTKYDNTIPGASDTSSTNGRIPLGTAGKADVTQATNPQMIKDGSIYKMWYTGYDGTNYRILYATSFDGLTWTKYDNSIPSLSDTSSTNGRVPMGNSGRGDSSRALEAAIIKDGPVYKLWYQGYDGTNSRIYYASMAPLPLGTSTDTTTKIEGTGSEKLTIGAPQVDANTVGLWHMEETSGTGAYIKDATANANHGTPTGTTVVDGFYGKARSFNGSQRITTTTPTSGLDGGSAISLEAWIYPTSTSTSYQTVIAKWNSTTPNDSPYQLFFSSPSLENKLMARINSDGGDMTSTGTVPLNTWSYVVLTYDSTTTKIYINGALDSSFGTVTGALKSVTTVPLTIGQRTNGTQGFPGKVDSVRVSNVVRTAEEIAEAYRAGRDHRISKTISSQDLSSKSKVPFWVASDRPGTYLETTIGESAYANYEPDANTVGLWHLEEAAGSGAYIKDSSGSGNNGTPTGTTNVAGKLGKARSFNGTSDYVPIGTGVLGSLANGASAVTMEAWVYPLAFPGSGNTARIANAVMNGTCTTGFNMNLGSTGLIKLGGRSTTSDAQQTLSITAPTSFLNNWHHIVGVFSYTNKLLSMYYDGQLQSSTSVTFASNTYVQGTPSITDKIGVGCIGVAGEVYFNGTIDEVRISNTARTAEEIAEAYRSGANHRLSKTISSANLSSSTKLPFYVAADRPGTYLEATVGESAYANYEPDANTVGLWHLEEQTGSGAYLKDSSGSGNNGTPTGTTVADGFYGKARSFNGTSSDYVNVGSGSSINFTSNFTLEAWINRSSTGNAGRIINHWNGTASQSKYLFNFSTDKLNIEVANGASTKGVAGNTTINANQWYHVAAVFSAGQSIKLYVNGVEDKSDTLSIPSSVNSTSLSTYFGGGVNENTQWFPGSIDEVRISNTARTADEIRQAYEIGKRTHPITIDFVSSPQAAYSSGTSVTVNNPWGTTNLTDTLSVGDTMIFKENVGGTETVSQATVNAVANTTATYGTVTLAAAPTFPSGGYTANASFFKWQREYFDITGSLAAQRDAITRLTLRVTNGHEGRTVWLDDFRSASYLADNAPDSFDTATGIGTYSVAGASIGSTLNRYIQTRSIFSSWDPAVSATLTSSSVEYGL